MDTEKNFSVTGGHGEREMAGKRTGLMTEQNKGNVRLFKDLKDESKKRTSEREALQCSRC